MRQSCLHDNFRQCNVYRTKIVGCKPQVNQQFLEPYIIIMYFSDIITFASYLIPVNFISFIVVVIPDRSKYTMGPYAARSTIVQDNNSVIELVQ